MVSARSRERRSSCSVMWATTACRPKLAARSAANAAHWAPLPNNSPPACAAATVTALANSPSRRHMPGISSSASMYPVAA